MHRDENKLPENQKIQWHPGFYAAAELELRHNRKDLDHCPSPCGLPCYFRHSMILGVLLRKGASKICQMF